MNLFEISTRRVLSVANQIRKGEAIKDRRSGDTHSLKQHDKLESVKQFIGKPVRATTTEPSLKGYIFHQP